MNLKVIADSMVRAHFAVMMWLAISFFWLFVPLFVLAHAVTAYEEFETRPAWAIGNAWAAYVIGCILLVIVTWMKRCWDDERLSGQKCELHRKLRQGWGV
jgi:hypothetical protein